MVKRIVTTACIGAALAVAGCGSGKLQHQAQTASANPQVKADQAKAEAIVQGCVRKANLFSKTGRKGFITCISPPGKQVQVERCVQQKAGTDRVFTHAGRAKFSQDVATCLL